jgi:hypothetical protein
MGVTLSAVPIGHQCAHPLITSQSRFGIGLVTRQLCCAASGREEVGGRKERLGSRSDLIDMMRPQQIAGTATPGARKGIGARQSVNSVTLLGATLGIQDIIKARLEQT